MIILITFDKMNILIIFDKMNILITFDKMNILIIFVTPGDQNARLSGIENLELSTFSKQAHIEDCSHKIW